MKVIAHALIVLLLITPVLADTLEAKSLVSGEAKQQTANFLTEFDITFWQTLPFAGLWSYFIASQLAGGGAVNWSHIGYFSVAASTLNAFIHAKKTTAAHSQ
jgi:hypothetical protein